MDSLKEYLDKNARIAELEKENKKLKSRPVRIKKTSDEVGILAVIAYLKEFEAECSQPTRIIKRLARHFNKSEVLISELWCKKG